MGNMGERSFPQGRTITSEGSSRLRSNRPDVTGTVSRPLRDLSMHVVTNRPYTPNGHQIEQSHVEDESGPVKALKITPLSTLPPLAHREVGIGGTRAIGGGTSKEAIRTAKRKERQKTGQKRSSANQA